MEESFELRPAADSTETPISTVINTAATNNAQNDNTIFDLPEEVQLKILSLLDPFDVWSLARTCKFFAQLTDNDLLWRHQWVKLSAKTPFRFPPSHSLQV
jgi:F-box-like